MLDIMNRKARLAWELYLKMETSAESFSLLQLIANDCYKVTMKMICFAAWLSSTAVSLNAFCDLAANGKVLIVSSA